MTVKEYFEQATWLQTRLAQQTINCLLLQREAESISSPGLDPRYGTGAKQAPYVAKVEKLEKEEEKRAALASQLDTLRSQMEKVIEQVDRPDWQALLRARYIQGMNVQQCCEMLYLCERSVMRYQRDAMKQIKLPVNAINLHLKKVTESNAAR